MIIMAVAQNDRVQFPGMHAQQPQIVDYDIGRPGIK